jgi:Xaa-Pro aminopeptidase
MMKLKTANLNQLHIPAQVYAQRRKRLAQQLAKLGGKGAVAVVPTAPERTRNADNTYPFRFESSFYYLTGFTEPEGLLVLRADGHATVFVRPKNETAEIWDGFRLGPNAAPAALKVDAAFSTDDIEAQCPKLLQNMDSVWLPLGTEGGTHDDLPAKVLSWIAKVRNQERMGFLPPQSLHNLNVLIDDMRLIKDKHEIAIMRESGRIAAVAHVRAMQASAQAQRDKFDLREFHLEAELLYAFRHQGAQEPSYGSIVAAGANACILHYAAGNAKVNANDLVLIDAGAELLGYASDITRTFPSGGKFTDAQRELYDIVVAAQVAAIKAAKPGARWRDPHNAAVKVLAQGMLDVGLLTAKKHGSLKNILDARSYRQFYMHGTSHWLGLDVHDAGDYAEPTEKHKAKATEIHPVTKAPYWPRPDRILRAGMVITIEPGIYVRPAPGVPKRFHDIGIRIEDDVLITSKGCELLTRDVPVKADEIEALMLG